MKKILRFSLLCIVLSTFGCSNDDSDNQDLALFVGNWSGTFSGDDSGTFTASINEDGDVSGSAYSNNLKQNIPLNGQIDKSGKFDAILGTSQNGASFTGQFTENASSGTWENPSAKSSGTWKGAKD